MNAVKRNVRNAQTWIKDGEGAMRQPQYWDISYNSLEISKGGSGKFGY